MAKKIIFGVSLALNILVILLVLLSMTRKSSSLFFLDLQTGENRYTTAATIISVPETGADVVFGRSDFTLRAGEEAALQFSVVIGLVRQPGRLPNKSRKIPCILLFFSGSCSKPEGYRTTLLTKNR